jgi:Zn-dependent protease
MRSWRVGSAFGIGLYVHWSFLLLPAYVGWMNLQRGGAEAGLVSVAVVFAVFGCVMLHELGHALMARVFGVGTRDITLYPIGGVARLERMPERPVEELAIAVAGPLVNVAIAAGLLGGMLLSGIRFTNELLLSGSFAELFLVQLLFSNVLLVLFNMIPAFPMDGGRVLRAVLAMFTGRLRATEAAVQIGMVFSILLIFAGLFYFAAPTMALVGLFVMFAGRQELAMLRYRERSRWAADRRDVVTVLPVDAIPPSAQPREPHFTGFTWDPRHAVWVQWRDGHPVGACSVGGSGAV